MTDLEKLDVDLQDFLCEIHDYLDQRQDDTGFLPNKEMKLLNMLESSVNFRKGQ